MTNVHVTRTLSTLVATGVLAGAAYAGMALGHATPTVNLTDVPNIDAMPTCELEDGSDSAVKPCVWTDTDTGNAYLTYSDHSVLVMDDTVSVAHGVAAADGGAPGPQR